MGRFDPDAAIHQVDTRLQEGRMERYRAGSTEEYGQENQGYVQKGFGEPAWMDSGLSRFKVAILALRELS